MIGAFVLFAAMQAVPQFPVTAPASPEEARAAANAAHVYVPGINTIGDLMKPVDPSLAIAECRAAGNGWIVVNPKVEISGGMTFMLKDPAMFWYMTEGQGKVGGGEWKEKNGSYVLKYKVKMGPVPEQTVFPKSEFWPCRPPA